MTTNTVKHTSLLPCPFCGGAARINTYRVAEDAMGVRISCRSCYCATTEFEDAYAPVGDATHAWNRRSPAPQEKGSR